MSFRNPLVSAGGDLAITSIHSPNFVSGSVGWSINKDGTVEFNSVGGSVRITSSGLFVYVPNAGIGNLRFAMSTADGVDPYGNSYHSGLFINQQQIWATGDNSHTVTLNPTGEIGPEILFTPAGFNATYEFRVDETNNRILFEPVNASNQLMEVNGPFKVTGAYQGTFSAQSSAPPLNVDGAFTAYTNAQWAYPTMKCPASETITMTMFMRAHNASSVNASIAVGIQIKDSTLGTTLFTPSGIDDAVYWNNDGATARANDISIDRTLTIGSDILGGHAGNTLQFVPMWRVSSHTVAPVISAANVSIHPSAFNQVTSSL